MTATGRENARTSAPLYTHSCAAGFTLIELLVSIAIFISIMAGISLLLIGSTRTSQQGFQNQQAFEIARGAMGLMQRDLSRAFSARNHGDLYTFYGTPIGFTFVGVTSPRDSGGANVARITYVIHRRPNAAVLRDVDDVQRDIYDLVRYVEPGAEDLDSFDVDWTTALVDASGDTLQDLIDNEVAASPCPAADIDCQEQVINAMRRQLWIRMLSRLEFSVLPDQWAVLDNGAPLNSLDYILAENILSVAEPGLDAFANPIIRSETVPFFEYAAFVDRRIELTGTIEDATDVLATPIEITSPGHGLTTDRRVSITGVEGNVNANVIDYITVIDADTFSLQFTNGTGVDPYTQGGVWTEDGRGITLATNALPIEITDLGHELATGEEIFVSGVTGNTAANGRHAVIDTGIDTVTLTGVDGTASPVYAGGGTWVRVGDIEDTHVSALPGTPIAIDDTAHGLQTGDEIIVSGVQGNTAANGRWFVTREDADNFSLNGSLTNNPAIPLTGDWIEATEEAQAKIPFWNDIRNEVGGLSNVGRLGTPLDPHMPEEIMMRFTLFFKAPAPGAPDFERSFDQKIDIPAGYQRPFREQ